MTAVLDILLKDEAFVPTGLPFKTPEKGLIDEGYKLLIKEQMLSEGSLVEIRSKLGILEDVDIQMVKVGNYISEGKNHRIFKEDPNGKYVLVCLKNNRTKIGIDIRASTHMDLLVDYFVDYKAAMEALWYEISVVPNPKYDKPHFGRPVVNIVLPNRLKEL